MKLVFSIIGLVESLFFFDQCWDIKNKALAAHAIFVSSYQKSILQQASVLWEVIIAARLLSILLLHLSPQGLVFHFYPSHWPVFVYLLSK